jgi:hypothetical protein
VQQADAVAETRKLLAGNVADGHDQVWELGQFVDRAGASGS